MLDLDGFRFYGCSLLMIYDGDKEAQEHFLRHSAQSPLGTHAEVDVDAATAPGHGGPPGGMLERVSEDECIDTRHQYQHQHRPNRTLATGGTHGEADIDHTSSHQSERTEYDPISHRSRSRTRQRREDEMPHTRSHSHSHSNSNSHTQTHDRHHDDDHSNHHHHRHHHQHHQRGSSHSTTNTKRIRGEVNIRVVDFAHTTTGLDFIPFPPNHVDPPDHELGKGYDTQLDPETGLNLARFPPKHPHQPDMGFVYGLKNVCAALEGIWRDAVGDEEVDRRLEGMGNRDVFVKAFGEEEGEDELST